MLSLGAGRRGFLDTYDNDPSTHSSQAPTWYVDTDNTQDCHHLYSFSHISSPSTEVTVYCTCHTAPVTSHLSHHTSHPSVTLHQSHLSPLSHTTPVTPITPHRSDLLTSATPKSVIFTSSLAVSKRLPGLISLWTTP